MGCDLKKNKKLFFLFRVLTGNLDNKFYYTNIFSQF